MEISGQSLIEADINTVWAGLNDPEVLQASIPGCESLEATGENQFKATVSIKIGPVKARFQGEVTLKDLNPPNGYVIVGSGSAGPMGAAKGNAEVTLSRESQGTRLDYTVNADLSGKIAQLGGRLIQSTAGVLAKQFFKNFSTQIEKPALTTPASNLSQSTNTVTGTSNIWIYIGIGAVLLGIIAYVVTA
ncbi:Carbon monoxide dehydrogenase subunit G (CoxG) [Pseudovibrio axinellae]|uniref:Carbon monoxide dehydrogenase subunit G (CoxG) n=1 Tax=Pseudovibrio axinellae TaxID=989403 RepID=A0A165T423_9HYPH|nr:carbon monoxide dehydrogenase subunit G [Pseudovibrio axinellae]KZL05404.1 Carbon monoxide dehydrogenase subunit G (CoxG) [Pseudovibrio axinellae]SEQ00684.1 hypothetical protein SAMN05421798_101928 [Pseudovibrio axinellae]